MLEVFILLVVIALMFYIGSFLFSVLAFVALVFFIFPGLYAMIFGAPLTITSKRRFEAMLTLGQFTKRDVVYDLGCGDGRVIHKISKKGVRKAIGYELSIPTFIVAMVRKWIVGGEEEIRFGNFWNQNYENATVLICFLLPDSMKHFEKKIWPKLGRGVKVLSNDAQMRNVKAVKELHKVYLYVKK
jgi:SAM-dependent methyltransferase